VNNEEQRSNHQDPAGEPSPTSEATRFWENHYGQRDQVWSGNPNPQLIGEATALIPGKALDVGCGEGADAIWLAERGWQVTAIDISTVAIARGAARAAELGAVIAQRIDWQQGDLAQWTPAEARYDLVSVQFFHLPKEQRDAIFRRLAAAVAPGGTLLIVGHHPTDLQVIPRPLPPEIFFDASDVAALLDPLEWAIDVEVARARPATAPDGRVVTLHDAVLRAHRRD
jgi:2-polyprenyl-3-methyl-5-hydroxy-6-metoxy-1,4-benzoquinol methylase